MEDLEEFSKEIKKETLRSDSILTTFCLMHKNNFTLVYCFGLKNLKFFNFDSKSNFIAHDPKTLNAWKFYLKDSILSIKIELNRFLLLLKNWFALKNLNFEAKTDKKHFWSPCSRLAANSKNHSALMLQKDLEKHIKVINRSEKTYENQMGKDKISIDNEWQ